MEAKRVGSGVGEDGTGVGERHRHREGENRRHCERGPLPSMPPPRARLPGPRGPQGWGLGTCSTGRAPAWHRAAPLSSSSCAKPTHTHASFGRPVFVYALGLPRELGQARARSAICPLSCSVLGLPASPAFASSQLHSPELFPTSTRAAASRCPGCALSNSRGLHCRLHRPGASANSLAFTLQLPALCLPFLSSQGHPLPFDRGLWQNSAPKDREKREDRKREGGDRDGLGQQWGGGGREAGGPISESQPWASRALAPRNSSGTVGGLSSLTVRWQPLPGLATLRGAGRGLEQHSRRQTALSLEGWM